MRAACWLTYKQLLIEEITMKRSIVTFLTGILSLIVALVFFVTVSGCQKQEGTMEKTGKKIDESIDKAKETMQDTAQKAEEKAKE
jgi:hypothetical protein